MATVLGLSFYYHDSAAALVKNGEIIAACAEERFSRKKHSSAFPKYAVEFCLDSAGISLNDIDAIVFYEKPTLKLFRVVESLVSAWPYSLDPFVRELPSFLSTKVNISEVIQQHLPGYKGDILFSEHHLSHAASAFFCSPFDRAAILTLDGVGEWETATMGEGQGRDIVMRKAIRFPHSMGLFYSALTGYLGFKVNDGEWKIMGLAGYGQPRYVDAMRKLMQVYPDGSFRMNLKYFVHQRSTRFIANNGAWEKLLGIPRRLPNAEILPCHEDLACSGQKILEEMILALARQARREAKTDNLVIAGGVGLNGLANWRIEKEGIFKNVWIQPAAGDDGGALGAALLVSETLFKESTTPMRHAYYGPRYSNEEIASFLEQKGIPHTGLQTPAMVDRVADLIKDGRVVGWFRGAMEFGPRALGARSILADAANPEMKDILNRKIKFREYFRPFAPSVPLEHVHEYFEVLPGSEFPFMIKVPQVRPEKRALIPAVTHADGTSRVQTVRAEDNPVYYELLMSLKEKIGVPIVLNTSFNIRGEPIVCRPEEAYRCFLKTDIDALVLEDHLLEKHAKIEINLDGNYKACDALELDETSLAASAVTASAEYPRSSLTQASGPSVEAAKKEVLHFYKELPFNYYSNSLDHASELMKKNPIQEYPYLNQYLKKKENAGMRILDVGCGSGWFVNSCVHYYHHQATGIDLNPGVLKQARSVNRFLPSPGNVEFYGVDVFKYEPAQPFDIVNSLGVLHHIPECIDAIKKCLSWVKPGGYFHLGLYHRYGRKPFLDYFKDLQRKGVSESELLKEFSVMNPNIKDPIHMQSWFRDQVLHPYEAQYTYADIAPILRSQGFLVQKTSINHYKSMTSDEEIIKLEKKLEALGKKALKRRAYYPGFFTLWSKKTGSYIKK